ncbi:hypothetical protein F4824DRAFT_399218 [Ustulina deusta]|nr:hypothetical protein F4823DRAFT_127574 [Ustulina deusta]KAI3340723.1 hypothetical protein F4824DRAFT_399218 [Ustulina deusta]
MMCPSHDKHIGFPTLFLLLLNQVETYCQYEREKKEKKNRSLLSGRNFSGVIRNACCFLPMSSSGQLEFCVVHPQLYKKNQVDA